MRYAAPIAAGRLAMCLLVAMLLGCRAVETIGFVLSDSDSGTDCPYPTMFVDGPRLFDACGEPFVPIGVNEMVVWSDDRTGAEVFPQIALTGANAVRFSWSTGDFSAMDATIAELDSAIENCNNAQMVAIVDIHDRGDALEEIPIIVDWWIRPDVVSVIAAHEKHLLINIANGKGPDSVPKAQYVAVFDAAVNRMREAGIRVPLIVETSGQGWDVDTLQAVFPPLLDADPLHNLLFGLHMWWPAPDGSTDFIVRELQESAELGMPLLLSEFAPFAQGCVQYIDYETILAEAHAHDFGFFPWSWGAVPNGDCEYLGMTADGIFGNWRDTPVGYWGKVVAETSEHSIRNRAKRSRSFGFL